MSPSDTTTSTWMPFYHLLPMPPALPLVSHFHFTRYERKICMWLLSVSLLHFICHPLTPLLQHGCHSITCFQCPLPFHWFLTSTPLDMRGRYVCDFSLFLFSTSYVTLWHHYFDMDAILSPASNAPCPSIGFSLPLHLIWEEDMYVTSKPPWTSSKNICLLGKLFSFL